MSFMMIKFFIMLINMLLSVGFFMLLERKLLGYIHMRKGPNKNLFIGLIQFILDFIKLLIKNKLYIYMINYYIYLLMLLFLILLNIMMWLFIPMFNMIMLLEMGLLSLIFLLTIKLMFLMVLIWSINSNYSMLSMVRLMVQYISYEILVIIYIMLMIIIIYSMNMIELFYNQNYLVNLFLNIYLYLIWYISILIELSRVPFDFYEGESELISGFMIEFSSLNFIIIFLMEYLDMLFMIYLTNLMYFNFNILSYLFYFMFMINLYLMLWVRGFLIRYRYDLMMLMMWKMFFFFLMNFMVYMYMYMYY